MHSKTFLFIFFAGIVLLSGCAGQSTPPPTQDPNTAPDNTDSADLSTPLSAIQSLADEVRIVFGREKPLRLRIPLQDENGIEYIFVDGKGIVAESIPQEKTVQAREFFQKYDFEQQYELKENELTILGYQLGSLICSVRIDDPDDNANSRLEVQCAKTPEQSAHKTLVHIGIVLKELLAAAYNTDRGKIAIEITKESEDHIRGNVSVGGEASETFFATKKDGPFTLVYSGEEPFPCEELKSNDFDARFITECEASPEAESPPSAATETDAATDDEAEAGNGAE